MNPMIARVDALRTRVERSLADGGVIEHESVKDCRERIAWLAMYAPENSAAMADAKRGLAVALAREGQ